MAYVPMSERIASREEAVRRLDGKTSRTLRGVDTRLRLRPGGDIDIVYHLTCVVTYHADGDVTIRTGGFTSATTKLRINSYSPISVYQKDWSWYANGEPWNGTPRTFTREDGEWVPLT